MRTIDDLRDVFANAAAAAPTELRDLERVLRAPRRRTRRVVAAAAAAAAVIGIGVGIAVTRGGGTPEPRPANPQPTRSAPATHSAHPTRSQATQPTPSGCPSGWHCPVRDDHGHLKPLPTHYTLGLAKGVQFVSRTLTPSYELLTLGSPGVWVRSYAPGAAPDWVVRGAPADVPGHDAYYVREAAVTSGASGPPGSAAHLKRVTWAEHGRTIVVTSGKNVLNLARAVRVVDRPVALPFRFDTLPSGLVPESLTIVPAGQGIPSFVTLGLSDGDPVDPKPPFTGYQPSIDDGGRSALLIATRPATVSAFPGRTNLHTRVGGHPAYGTYSDHQLFVALSTAAGLEMVPDADRVADYDATYFARLAQHMTFAPDVSDSSTWFSSHLFP